MDLLLRGARVAALVRLDLNFVGAPALFSKNGRPLNLGALNPPQGGGVDQPRSSVRSLV